MKKRRRISDIFYNNKFVFVFSVVMAVIIWAVITIEKTPETTVTISDVPITIDTSGLEGRLGLTAFGDTSYTANVTVKGQRFIVDSDSVKDSISITANTGSVTAPGTYSLRVDAESTNDSISIEDVSVSNISVYFDYLAEQEFDVKAIVSDEENIVPDGFVAGDAYITDNPTVKVSGPESEVNKITGITANVIIEGPVTETQTVVASIEPDVTDSVNYKYVTFYRSSGTSEVSDVTVTVPVYKITNLETSAGFTGKPSSFTGISYTVSPSNVKVGVPESRLDTITSFVVKKIDFSTLNVGTNKFTYSASEAETTGVMILDGTDEFTISVTVTDVESKAVEVSKTVETQNVPKNVKVKSITPNFEDVMVIGPAEQVEKITAENLSLVADLSNVDPEKAGTYTVPVTFTDEYCWIHGTYTATVTIE